MRLTVTFTWRIDGPLHVGDGMSRAGYADRLVRKRDGSLILPGDAVKGAIRGSAERLAAWLLAQQGLSQAEEREDHSVPRNRVVERIFAPLELPGAGACYRFRPGKAEGKPRTIAATQIDDDSGVADDDTLRIIEVAPRGLTFDLGIQGWGGAWDDETSRDRDDLLFLGAAILAADGIGGKRGIGCGRIVCEQIDLGVAGVTRDHLCSWEVVGKLSKHLAGNDGSDRLRRLRN